VIDIVHTMIETAERYGLKILYIDATDITLMARMEVLPGVYIQVYQNIKKEKLNMALIIGNDRAYGVDSEGGIYHEHPAEDPVRHLPVTEKMGLERFVVRCLNILKDRGIL